MSVTSVRLQLLLRAIGEACERKPLTEAEVEKVFQEHGLFGELGYEGIGKDILAQRGRFRKRFDLALLDFGGRVRVVVEFKRAGVGPLESFRKELDEKYVKPHSAAFGVLTNGVNFALYARANGELVEQLSFRLSETTPNQASDIANWLRKRTVDLDSLESVLELLKTNRQQPLLISSADSEPAKIFFQVFQLSAESAFGRLVRALKRLLPTTLASSGFACGSYEFWQKTYARELAFKDVPASWRPLLDSESSTEIARFSFALETAYTIVSRLVLAKAADDRRFPGVRFVPRLQESFSELSTRERVSLEHYLEVVRRSFDRAGQTLFDSIFSQDIFDWWFECPTAESRDFLAALGEATLLVTQFDFSDLSGDLLGEMYQRHFDRDTRKALGEFYTPAGVIELILDECGYTGQPGHRLLDPACGSGSFLVAALRRYLRQQSRSSKESALRDLTEGLRIVGFDINPFAVLMAQINYAAMILPLYAEAVYENPEFRIIRLPIFRTDSLRVEEQEGELGRRSKQTLQVNLHFEEKVLDVSIYLPIREGPKRFLREYIKVPRYSGARQEGLVINMEEYVSALALVFRAARDRRRSLQQLLQARFAERADRLNSYLLPTSNALESTLDKLKGKYDDGRFLKTIEDLVLAVSLKQDLQYDYVVANPPYVRVQKIPDHVKEYWPGNYEWTAHNYDLYIPFLERAVRSPGGEGWLGKQGRLGFIVSDRFLNVDYGEKLREELPKALRVDLLMDLRDTRVFAGALNYPAILIAERDKGGRTGSVEAARVFASEAGFDALVEEFRTLRSAAKAGQTSRGSALEVFGLPRDRLKGPGWWLMPPEEAQVLDKVRKTPGRRLIDLTESASGGFAGYQTSADPILVFDEVGEAAQFLRVRPRHKVESCNCREAPLEIEKGVMRPFLFGKDVGPWSIDWKRTWIMFPYDRYGKKRTLLDQQQDAARWNLIPCRDNIDKFDLLNPEEIETIEDRYPRAWAYLRDHEEILRKREDQRFARGRTEGHMWYGATYPRGLDHYFRPKIVLQLLSRRSSFALDPEGRFVFQAGGKGGGVYGIVPDPEVISLPALLAFLNSRLADFLIKQTSSVYAGRFYSYADQFLRDLPISSVLLDGNSEASRQLELLAGTITRTSERRAELARKIELFPGSFESDLSEYELDTVGHLCSEHPRSAQLTIDVDSICVEPAPHGCSLRQGSLDLFEFACREQTEVLAQTLRQLRRKSVPLQQVLNWRLPVRPEGCKKLLGLLDAACQELRQISQEIASRTGDLNELVYEVYGVSPSERQVVEEFLNRYTSRAAGTDPQPGQTDDERADRPGNGGPL